MIRGLKAGIGRNRVVLSNFGYLSALQLVTVLLPLATYPYLIRILGAELWGKVVLAQTIVGYFVIFLNFGFDISATKEVAVNRDNKEKLSEVISSVFIIKTFFLVASAAILIIMIALIPAIRKELWLYIFSFGLCINEWIFPIWYFQGIERMKYITYINLISKVIFFLLIFLVIKAKDDYLFVPLLNGTGALIGGLVSIWVVFGNHKIQFKVPKLKNLVPIIKESFPLFTSKAIISVKDRFNVIFIGVLLGNAEIAFYDLGIKLVNLFSVFVDTVNKVIYPKIAREKRMGFLKKSIIVIFTIVLILVFVAQITLSKIVLFLGGHEMLGAIDTIRILLFAPIFFSVGIPLARNLMILFGKTKAYLFSVILTVVFYLTLIGLLYLIPSIRKVEVFAIVVVAVYGFETIYRLFYCKKVELL